MKRIAPIVMAALVLTGCGQKDERYVSTVVNADGTITFNYKNANAKSVQVDAQFSTPTDMQKDPATGMWSVTLGPAEPDMYPYCFIVDGVSVMDPMNQQYFPNEGFKNSLLDIPGKNGPLIHSIQNVPHGNVDYIKYYSNSIKTYNYAIVYTPPTYGTSNKDYPVFYLVSGTTDTEEVYYKVGRMNYILDNLIAQGKAKEMIIVLPYGNPSKLMTGRGGFGDSFGGDLLNDLMPYVESHYRTINDRDHRGIGGFSRGGNQGLAFGLSHLDLFSYLCSYSSFTQTSLPGGVYDDKDINNKIHLFWSGVGTDDFLFGNSRDYTEFLDSKGITCVKEYTHDKFGHTWMNAKYFLSKTMPLLFNEEASAAAMAAAQPTLARTGQEQQFTASTMARLFPQSVASPVIKADGVTFNISAPEATMVKLEGEMLQAPVEMTKSDRGLWSITLSDLGTDIYCYNFDIDGTKVADAQNMYLAPDYGFKRSVLDLRVMPEAKIEYTPVRYICESLEDGTQHTYAMVTPMTRTREALPQLALVAGPKDTFESWYKIAKANETLDQMVAAGECKPCILVMTDRPYAGAQMTLKSSDYKSWADARAALVSALKKLSQD